MRLRRHPARASDHWADERSGVVLIDTVEGADAPYLGVDDEAAFTREVAREGREIMLEKLSLRVAKVTTRG